jgi:aldehyde:ferredoxin oxidoreductase
VGQGTPLGRILGNGAAVTGKVFGIERVPVVKGAVHAGLRSARRAGHRCHLRHQHDGGRPHRRICRDGQHPRCGRQRQPTQTEGQIELSRNLQIATTAIDATGMCLFIAFAILDQPETFQALVDMLSAFGGTPLTADDVTALGTSILKAERDFNERAGFTKQDDRLPDYFKKESLSPHKVTFAVTDQELDQVFKF